MIQVRHRRGTIGKRQTALCAALPVALDRILCAKRLPAVLSGGPINSGSDVRIVRLQESLQAYHPTSIVLRDSSGRGTLLHWPHLLDRLVRVLALPPVMLATAIATAKRLVAAMPARTFARSAVVALFFAVPCACGLGGKAHASEHASTPRCSVSGLPHETLPDRLNQEQVPPWQRLIAADPTSGNLLYRVMR